MPANRAIAISAVVAVLVLLVGIGIDLSVHPQPSGPFAACRTSAVLAPREYTAPPAMCIDPKANYSAEIVTNLGTITVTLLTSSAPQTVNNFVVLAENGYYNGLTFFSTESWLMQSGDPDGNGLGGPGYGLPLQPMDPNDAWDPGSLGMAPGPDGTLNGGQFFITTTAWPGGAPTVSYNHFGTVTLNFELLNTLNTNSWIETIRIHRG